MDVAEEHMQRVGVEGEMEAEKEQLKETEAPAAVPVCRVVCYRLSGWCRSLGGLAATVRCCIFPSCLSAGCPSSRHRLSYTRGTASCHPEEEEAKTPESHVNQTISRNKQKHSTTSS